MSTGLPSHSDTIFPPRFWKARCPLKMILFSWVVFSNRNLTWEVLQRKGWQGPGRCPMCQFVAETNAHMFFQCASTTHIWCELSLSYGFPNRFFSYVQDGFKWWSEQCPSWRTLFILACWFLWKWRNAHIFQDSRVPLASILFHILAYLDPSG